MKITLKMIADEMDVSPITVSRALRGTVGVSEQLAACIREKAERMGYYKERRNIKKTSLAVNYLYPCIAVLVPEITSYFYSNSVTELQRRIEDIGGIVQIHITNFDYARFNVIIDRLNRDDNVDFILSLSEMPLSTHSRIPIRYMIPPYNKDSMSVIGSKWNIGLKLAVEHLISLGHTRIGLIGELNTLSKQRSFVKAMELHDIPIRDGYVFTSTSRFERIGLEAISHMFVLDEPPTALVAAYDEIAFGAIYQLNKLGFSVPNDVSIVGYNDVTGASYCNPPLTTVCSNMQARIETAVKYICSYLCDEALDKSSEDCEILPKLIIRESTAKIKQSIT